MAFFQAGIKYETTVRPRVKQYLNTYPDAKTTSQFADLIACIPVSTLINWKPSAKTERIESLTAFLLSIGIETQNDFAEWLSNERNIIELKKQPGVGPKTSDYFKILVGHETNAIDRHLLNFIKNAGLESCNYDEAKTIISESAEILGINEAVYDHSIWRYMSES